MAPALTLKRWVVVPQSSLTATSTIEPSGLRKATFQALPATVEPMRTAPGRTKRVTWPST